MNHYAGEMLSVLLIVFSLTGMAMADSVVVDLSTNHGNVTGPGTLVQYFAALERQQVDSASHSCWNDVNSVSNCYNSSLDGLLTSDTKQPRSTWGAEDPARTQVQAILGNNGGAASLGDIQIFPNPFRPLLGHTQMNFTQLPPGARVRIYTLAGEKVNDLTADNLGHAAWDGTNLGGRKAASGVYFVLVEGGGDKKTYKVAIQR